MRHLDVQPAKLLESIPTGLSSAHYIPYLTTYCKAEVFNALSTVAIFEWVGGSRARAFACRSLT